MDTPSIPRKRCTKCGVEYPVTSEYFYKLHRTYDGFMCRCKACEKASDKQRYLKEREKRIKHALDAQKAQPEKLAERKARYYRKNRGRWHDYKVKRRGLEARGTLSQDEVNLQYRSQKGLCWWCSKPLNGDYHIDHRIALDRGGLNDAKNIVCACAKCNLSKGRKLPHEWAGRLL